MKVAFFAYLRDGRPSGFQPWKPSGRYVGHMDDPEEPEALIDVTECETFNDAKRHVAELAGWDVMGQHYDAWGDEEWIERRPGLQPAIVSRTQTTFCPCCGEVPLFHLCPGPMF